MDRRRRSPSEQPGQHLSEQPNHHPPEPVTPEPPRALRRTLFTQFWREVVFLHWRVPPETVAPLMPPGTRPDVLDGTSRFGLVGFGMEGLGFGRGGPPVPYLGTFPEINVRLYSVDRRGRRGVVFLSLDSSRLLPVAVARAVFGLPYRWASCAGHLAPGRRGYTVRPYGRRKTTSRFGVTVGPPLLRPSAEDHFVTARWGLHVRAWGRTWYLPNRHPAWPLHAAELVECAQDLLARSGLPLRVTESGAPDSVLYSPGVPVSFGTPEVLPER